MKSQEIKMDLSIMTQEEIESLKWFLKRNPKIEKITTLINKPTGTGLKLNS